MNTNKKVAGKAFAELTKRTASAFARKEIDDVDVKKDYAQEVIDAKKAGDNKKALEAAAKRAVKIAENPKEYARYIYPEKTDVPKNTPQARTEAEFETQKPEIRSGVFPIQKGKGVKNISSPSFSESGKAKIGSYSAGGREMGTGVSTTAKAELEKTAKAYDKAMRTAFGVANEAIITNYIEKGARANTGNEKVDNIINSLIDLRIARDNAGMRYAIEKRNEDDLYNRYLKSAYGIDAETFGRSAMDLKNWADKNNYIFNAQDGTLTPKKLKGKKLSTLQQDEDAKKLLVIAAQNNITEQIKNSKTAAAAYNTINTLAAPARSIVGGLFTAKSALGKMFGQDIDIYDEMAMAQHTSEAIKRATDEEYASKWFGGKEVMGLGNVGSFLYGAGTSALENAVNLTFSNWLTGGLGLTGEAAETATANITSAIMGSDVAANTVINAKKEGASDGKALVKGISAGAIEWLTEKYSIEAILKGGPGLMKTATKSFIAEGSEEVASNWLNRVVDSMLSPATNDLSMQYYTYLSKGATPKEALTEVMSNMFSEDIQAAAAGGLAGIAMGGAFRGTQSLQDMRAGKYIAKKGAVNSLISQALNMGENTESNITAQRMAQEIAEGKTPSNKALGELLRTFAEEGGRFQMPETEMYDKNKAPKGFLKAVDKKLVDFIEQVKKNPTDSKSAYSIGRVSNRLSSDIKNLTGIDTKGFAHRVKANSIRHILKRHGENGVADKSMANVDNIARMGYVLDNYDSIELSKERSAEYMDRNQKLAPKVIISKKVDGTYYVVEAVPDTNAKRLEVVSAFINKSSKAADPGYTSPSGNVRNASADNETSINPTLPQNESGVNTYDMQNEKNNAGILKNEASERFRAVRPKFHTVLDGVGKRLGVSIVIDEEIENADGYFDPETSEIHISANAQNPLREVIKHEITHVLEGTKEYDELVSFMKESFSNDWNDTESRIRDLYERINKARELSGKELINITDTKIAHETMAEFAEQFKSDEFLERVANENPTMLGKIKNFISDIIARFKGVFSSEEVKRWQEAEKKWENAFNNADVTARSGEREYKLKTDKNGNKYWQIESNKDIFANLNTVKEYEDAAYNFILGNRDNKVLYEDVNGKKIKFIRLSAEEFTNSEKSKTLKKENPDIFKKKMRLIPSLQDLLLNNSVEWESPDHKGHNLFKEKGFRNYRGRVRIDDIIFNSIVRVGMTENDNIFYDINLEVDSILPHTNNSASEIQKSTSTDNRVTQNKPVVNTYNTQNSKKDTQKEFKLQEPKGISQEDVKSIQSIGSKSVNDFTSEDIKKTEAFARQYFKEMGVKSPFFRNFFGDWRAKDNSEVSPIEIEGTFKHKTKDSVVSFIKEGLKNHSLFRGDVRNSDMSVNENVFINIGAQIYNDTLTYALREYSRDNDIDNLNTRISMLNKIKNIVKNSILLNTEISNNGANSLFMHSLYDICAVDNKPYLLILRVEEFGNDDLITRRAYNLNKIEISPVAVSHFVGADTTDDAGEIISPKINVSQLFDLVKTYDKDFKPKPTSIVLNKDGTPKVLYHRSNKQFSVYDLSKSGSNQGKTHGDGIYLSSSKNEFEYAGDVVYELYAHMEHPFKMQFSEQEANKIYNKYFEPHHTDEFGSYRKHVINALMTRHKVFDYLAEAADNANIKTSDILTEMGYDGVQDGIEYVVFSPNQIKSATDNIGTFDKENEDIRYKFQDPGDIDAEYGSYVAAVEAENAEIKELNESLKREIMSKRTLSTNPARINEVVARIKKDYKSSVNLKETAGAVQEIWERIVALSNTSPKWFAEEYPKEFYKLAKIGTNIVENTTEGDRTLYDQYKDLRKHIRNTAISISDSDASSIPDFNAFKRSNFGRMKITKNTTFGVDSFYQELCEMYPEFFTDDITHPADQLLKISEVLDYLKPKITTDTMRRFKNMYGIDFDDAGNAIAAEIINTLQEDNPYDAQTTTEYLKKSFVKDYKDKYDRLKKEYGQRLEDYREERKEREAREKLLGLARFFQKLRTTPENLEKIPEIVKELDTMGISLLEKGTKDEDGNVTRYGRLELKELRDKYNEALAAGGETNKFIEEKINRLDRKQIADLDISDVYDLITTLQAARKAIWEQNRLIRDTKRREVYQTAQGVIKEVRNVKNPPKEHIGYQRYMLSPLRMARRMVNYAKNSTFVELFDKLNEGNHKRMEFLQQTAIKFLSISQQKEELEKVSGKNATVKTYRIGGTEFKLTPAMRIALYLHSQCEANMNHIKYGGIYIPDIKLYNKGDFANAYSEARGAKQVKLTKQDIEYITRDMTAFERQIAETASKWLNEDCKKAINETSLDLLGYEVARVGKYMPIKTSDNFTKSEPLIVDGTLEGQGMLKERQNGVNAIKLVDIIRVIDMQKEGVARYYGLAIPLRNFNAVYNSMSKGMEDSVKSAIDSVWGGKYNGYIDDMLADLQNGRKSDGDFSKMLRKYRGNYAQAVLSMNLPVTIKQAASYPTAAAVIGWKPLMEAMGEKMTDEDKEMIHRYTPLLWYRMQGYSMQEIGDFAAGKDGLSKRLPLVMGTIQKVDVATTTKLWKAAEIYVRRQGNFEKGSREYYKEVAKVYNSVIENTQPNYEAMQRPGVLRSPNEVVKSLAMFATQRFQNYNILSEAIGELKAAEDARDEEWVKEAKRNAYNAVSSQIVANVVISAMNFAGALVLHGTGKWKDEEEDKYTFGSAARGFVDDFLSSFFGIFWGGSEAYQMLKSLKDGERWYDITMPATDILNGIAKQAVEFGNIISDHDRRFHIKEYIKPTTRFAESAFQALGIPAQNAGKLVNAAFEYSLDALEKFGIEQYSTRYWKMKITTPESKRAQYGKFLQSVAEAALSEENPKKRETILSQLEYISEDMKRYMDTDYVVSKEKLAFKKYISSAIAEASAEADEKKRAELFDKVNMLNKEAIRFIGVSAADAVKKDAIKNAGTTSSADKYAEELEKTKPEEVYEADYEKDGTRYITYDGEKHKLTVEQEIKYLQMIDDYTGDLYDKIIGNGEDISTALMGSEKHTAKTTKTEEKRVYDYFYRKYENGEITEVQLKSNYDKYLSGELEVPVLKVYMQGQDLTYSQLTYSQRKDVIETEEKKVKKGEISQADFEKWKKGFESGNITVSKSLQIIDRYSDYDKETQHKVLGKIKKAAEKKAQSDMRGEVMGG